MYLNVDFIATSLVSAASGVASAVVLIQLRLVGTVGSRCGMGIDTLVAARAGLEGPEYTRGAIGPAHADYAYRLAVDPQPAKELRLFGLAGWAVERFIARRKRLFELQYRATRLREKPVIWCMIIVILANWRCSVPWASVAPRETSRSIASSCTPR